jgi:hypothetical protein
MTGAARAGEGWEGADAEPSTRCDRHELLPPNGAVLICALLRFGLSLRFPIPFRSDVV